HGWKPRRAGWTAGCRRASYRSSAQELSPGSAPFSGLMSMNSPMPINTTREIIEDLKRGQLVILMDDADRENEGDLVIAAEHVTPEAINFMAKYGRGLICMPITEERARKLNLAPMVAVNRSPHGTNFTVSIE